MAEQPPLRLLQEQVFALIRSEGPGAIDRWVVSDSRLSATGRIGIYAEMYFLRLLEAMLGTFPRLAAVLGDERFAALARAYLAAHPPCHPSLRQLGERLPDFLAGARRPKWPVWSADLAALEWHRYDLFDAADVPLLTLATVRALSGEALADLPIRLAPASRLFSARHPIETVWRAVKAGSDVPYLGPIPTTLLVWRQGTGVYHRPLQPLEAAALSSVSSETTFADVCERIVAILASGSRRDDAPTEAARAAFSLLNRWVGDEILTA